jgi:hypothetical protein
MECENCGPIIVLAGRKAVPEQSLAQIPPDAETALVKQGEIELAILEIVGGRFREPARRCHVVRPDLQAIGKQHRGIVHGADIAGCGGNAGAVLQKRRHAKLCRRRCRHSE